MPYISKEARLRLDQEGEKPQTEGEYCYLVYRELLRLYKEHGSNFRAAVIAMRAVRVPFPPELGLDTVGITISVMAEFEFYRRIVAPYEDKKIEENGDIPI